MLIYKPMPWTLKRPDKGNAVELSRKTGKKDHQKPKRGNIVGKEVWVTLQIGKNELGRHKSCGVVLHTDQRCSRVHGVVQNSVRQKKMTQIDPFFIFQVEIEPHPHIREACSDHEFDRDQASLCWSRRMKCPMVDQLSGILSKGIILPNLRKKMLTSQFFYRSEILPFLSMLCVRAAAQLVFRLAFSCNGRLDVHCLTAEACTHCSPGQAKLRAFVRRVP